MIAPRTRPPLNGLRTTTFSSPGCSDSTLAASCGLSMLWFWVINLPSKVSPSSLPRTNAVKLRKSHSPEPPETGDTSINTSYTDTISNTSIQQPLDFTVLFEPELSDTLTKLANATTFESSDSVSFQPCRQAGVNQDRTVLEKWNYAQQYVGSESWRFAGIFDGSCIINVVFGCE